MHKYQSVMALLKRGHLDGKVLREAGVYCWIKQWDEKVQYEEDHTQGLMKKYHEDYICFLEYIYITFIIVYHISVFSVLYHWGGQEGDPLHVQIWMLTFLGFTFQYLQFGYITLFAVKLYSVDQLYSLQL